MTLHLFNKCKRFCETFIFNFHLLKYIAEIFFCLFFCCCFNDKTFLLFYTLMAQINA